VPVSVPAGVNAVRLGHSAAVEVDPGAEVLVAAVAAGAAAARATTTDSVPSTAHALRNDVLSPRVMREG
jgi:hypothetical protein